MTACDSRSGIGKLSAPSWWICALLGAAMMVAGVLALSDVVFATLVSVKLIGWTVAAVGAFEVLHAFWTKGWGGFLWQILLGALYLALGFVMLTQPASGLLVLTGLLGSMLFASGLIRCLLSFAYWRHNGWIMLFSGVIGLTAGLIVLSGFPATSAWVLGFLLGVDLISHGLAWLLYALLPAPLTAQ